MPGDVRDTLRGWLRELTLGPLEPYRPGENRYVRLEESSGAAVDEIQAMINLRSGTTCQLLSGPNGSGKTTELNRLRGALSEAGFTVAIVDILQFVNRSSPIDVTDFLIAIALGVSERFPSPPDSKNSQPFSAELGKKPAFQIGSLYAEAAEFFGQVAAADRAINPRSRGLVLIVDNLEKLRGTQDNDREVQASVERLFLHHADKLRFESLHTVYSVPAYLLFTAPSALPYDGRVRPVPILQVRNRDGEVDDNTRKSIAALAEVVDRRIKWRELLGTRQNLDTVITASGGHLRDLFQILHQIITLVYGRGLPLPVTAADVEQALDNLVHSFANVTSERVEFLRKVAAARGAIEPNESEVHLMARLMDTHMLLGHLNHRDWYEVHPLARRALGLA